MTGNIEDGEGEVEKKKNIRKGKKHWYRENLLEGKTERKKEGNWKKKFSCTAEQPYLGYSCLKTGQTLANMHFQCSVLNPSLLFHLLSNKFVGRKKYKK